MLPALQAVTGGSLHSRKGFPSLPSSQVHTAWVPPGAELHRAPGLQGPRLQGSFLVQSLEGSPRNPLGQEHSPPLHWAPSPQGKGMQGSARQPVYGFPSMSTGQVQVALF